MTASVATRAGDVSYTILGEGRPLLMLHASLHDSHDFDPIVFQLADRFQTITLDWPWHGASRETTTKSRDPSAVLMAEVLEDFVTALDLPPAIIIGNSVGGFAAARLAITHPDRVQSLILVNTGGFPLWNVFIRTFCYLLGFPTVSRVALPHMIPAYMKPQTPSDTAILQKAASRARTWEGASVAAAMWRSFLDKRHDLRSEAKAIRVPTLIIWGTKDIVPVENAHLVQKSIPGSQLELFDAGHVVFSSKPNEFLEVVNKFLE
ncbi:uncharacterized protein N7496_009977 [Penicillium cataractarum]|uniref:AB hydrolase-1 domain-containing protein n=1 Tax=Penicillium cataractarum TaxID=2100454 RepID=A0A9W9RSL7_9EURO|nr:uncharacterized protein N7496_009977 [Penicillium cataractarum]KAJ5364264.1 hypothetical protein N7496_009977 [Penicillium cataractarum]